MIRATVLVSLLLSGSSLATLSAQSSPRQVDTTEAFVLRRSLDSLRTEREAVGRRRGEADARYSVGRARIAESETQRSAIEKAIEGVDLRIKTAKKEKREADKTAAEAEKKDWERRKDLAERRLDLRRAEAAQSQAEMDYADATSRALELEQQLEQRRLDQAGRETLVDLEQKTLESRLEQEYRRKMLADRRSQLVERQLAVMATQKSFFLR